MADFIDRIIDSEGAETNDPEDSGGHTKYGISEKAHPEAWADGDVTRAEARDIYQKVYITGERLNTIPDPYLQHQLVDFGVISGADTSVKLLQQLVGVNADGELGPQTLAAVTAYPDGTLFGVPVPGRVLLNLAVRDARIMFYGSLVKRRPKDLKFLLGWLRRALEFQ